MLVDVGVGEGLAERRHRAFLTVLDAVADEIVAARGVHQLWAFASDAAAVGVAKAADGGEQLLNVEGGRRRRARRIVGAAARVPKAPEP